MRIGLHIATLAILVLALPFVALADLTGSPTLNTGQAFSLDTGVIPASDGDVLWSGATLTLQGNATTANLRDYGFAEFSDLTQATLASFSGYSKLAIPAASLPVGEVFAVHTNGGNYAAVLVTGTTGTSISISFITFEATLGPVITEIQNNYGNIPAGFPNSGIAQGALFYIVGTGLASSTPPLALQNPVNVSLPTTLNGATVKVTVGGTTVRPAFYYAEPTALGLVLPSNTPLGTAQVTVTYNNQTSASYPIQVVSAAMGFDTYYGTGTGLGIAVFEGPVPAGGGCAQASIACYTLSIPPGTGIELYGSGLGADPNSARDTTYVPVTTAASGSINGLQAVYVGGIPATIQYQGASGYPGLNQIVITIPTNAPTGCNVSVVGVSAAGVPTNSITLPIGTGTCSDPAFGTSGTQLQALSGQAGISSGILELLQSTVPGAQAVDLANGYFEDSTGVPLVGTSQLSLGGCSVSQTVLPSAASSIPTAYLDAGAITVTGPSGSPIMMAYNTASESYNAEPAAGYIPATGGIFTFQGTGGANVGPFTATVNFPSPLLSWTNESAAANFARSSGLTVTWTGGASASYVIIAGTSAALPAIASFKCFAPVSAGQFTVPSYVLSALPAGSGGVVSVREETVPAGFTATGLSYGAAIGAVSYSVSATYN